MVGGKKCTEKMNEVKDLINNLANFKQIYPDAPYLIPRMTSYEKHFLQKLATNVI